MIPFPPLVASLRALHRGYKLLFVLFAAWAPLVLSHVPVLACLVAVLATVLFFVSVSQPSALESENSPVSIPDEPS
jgi:hypothetical protein